MDTPTLQAQVNALASMFDSIGMWASATAARRLVETFEREMRSKHKAEAQALGYKVNETKPKREPFEVIEGFFDRDI